MGLMDPEELSCSGVKTDKDSVINSLGFPEQNKEVISEDGHLTALKCREESSTSLALSLVNDILEESIEIFNQVEEANFHNNNASCTKTESPLILNQSVSNPGVSPDKTDQIVAISDYVDLSEIDRETCNNFDNTSPINSTTDIDSAKNSTKMLLNSVCLNDHKINRIISSSSDEDSESPLVSETESSLSQSNENIPTHFSNLYIDKMSEKSDKNLVDIESNDNNYSEVLLVQNPIDKSSQDDENIRAESTVLSLNCNYESSESFEPYLVEPNGFQSSLTTGNVESFDDVLIMGSHHDSFNVESCSDNYTSFADPATIQVSESSIQHVCFNHPDVVELRRDNDELKKVLPVYKEKADRLDDCLIDLEKMLDKVGFLEKKICQQEMELDLSKQEKDIESRALTALRHETSTKIESLKKQFDQANKEKESMVMRYAKSEKELLDMKKEKATLMKQIKDQQKENENVLSKLRQISDDKSRLAVGLDNKNMELSTSHKEIDKLKEDINSRDIKIKWIQNKLIGEMDLHKDCPDKIDKLNGQILELEKKLDKNKEDIEQYKKSIQELEAIKVLEGQVREEQAKLILERHDQSERVIKMKALQLKTDALIEENNHLSFQVQNLEVDRLNIEKRLSESRQESQELSNNLADFRSKLVEFDSISNQLTQERERLEKANEEVERLRKANEELMQDMSTCRSRESEMLSFTQKLTTKNVQLQSEFSNIESRAGELMLEAEKSESCADTLRRELKLLKEELEIERCKREEERNLLAREVAEGRSKITQLESQLTETKSNLHSSTNKHQALIRELQRELQVCHRRLEHEGKSFQHQNDSRSNAGSSPNQSSTGRSSLGASSSLTSSLNSIPDATIVQPSHVQLEVSPSILVERILKLQTDSKNYHDKIEFLEDHNTTLVEELKKKGRLLHSYILREQAGALSSQASDNHKLEVSKHGGIMASVYGSRPTDEGMTLELSLQINHKLQAILEDTLLKNITLKENIDTLGDEIERLKKLHPS